MRIVLLVVCIFAFLPMARAQEVKPAESAIESGPSASENLTPQQESAKEPEKKDDNPDEEENSHAGLLLPFGKVGVLVDLDVPHIYSISVDARLFDLVNVGVSVTPKSTLSVPGTLELSISHWNVHAQLLPFRGSFLLGVNLGSHTISASASQDIDYGVVGISQKIPTKVDASISALFVTPHFGWQWCGSILTVGTELGVQIPFSSSATFDANFQGLAASSNELVKQTQDYKDLQKQAEDAAKVVASTPFPYWTILKLGIML